MRAAGALSAMLGPLGRWALAFLRFTTDNAVFSRPRRGGSVEGGDGAAAHKRPASEPRMVPMHGAWGLQWRVAWPDWLYARRV